RDPGARAQVLLDDLGNRASLVPHAGDERAEVVHRTDEYPAEHDPEEEGQPAELGGRRDRADDGTGGCDRAEVLAEEIEGPRGLVVEAVAQGHRWRDGLVVEPVRGRHEATIEAEGGR